MINTRIKIIHLDGMIIRTGKFVVNLEVKEVAKETNKVIVRIESGEIIHSSVYKETDGLSELIEGIETEAEKSDKNEKVYLDIVKYLKGM